MKRQKGKSSQELLGVRSFTRYGLKTNAGELLFFLISPTNISVLSSANIEMKIQHWQAVLSAYPELEVVCTDASECFDANKAYLKEKCTEEENPKVRSVLQQDMDMLEELQMEMASARQFLLLYRCKGLKPEKVFEDRNKVEKVLNEKGFEVKCLEKADIKRFLALYFEASLYGEAMPDVDGGQFFKEDVCSEGKRKN